MNSNQTVSGAAGMAVPPGMQGVPGVPGGGVGGGQSHPVAQPANSADAERFGALLNSGDGRQGVQQGVGQGVHTPGGSVTNSGNQPGAGTPGGLQQPGAKPSGTKDSRAHSHPVQDNMAELLGQAASSLLDAMGGSEQSAAFQTGAQSEAGVSSGAGVHAPAGLSSLHCDELVERILVSQPSTEGTAEVRIRVNESWLRDTDIVLVKTPDAAMTVEFMTDDVDSQRTLLPNLSDLRGRLAERTGERVTVRMTEHASQEHAGQGQPDDGRSRNRRNLYEEIEDRK